MPSNAGKGASFDLKEWSVLEHRPSKGKLNILYNCKDIFYTSISFSGSQGRGLEFTSKTETEEVAVIDEKGKPVMEKGKPKMKKVPVKKFYTGDVGGDPSKHDENMYKGIAKEIMEAITTGDDKKEVWPASVTIQITKGGKEVPTPWTQRKDREDFLHGGHF